MPALPGRLGQVLSTCLTKFQPARAKTDRGQCSPKRSAMSYGIRGGSQARLGLFHCLCCAQSPALDHPLLRLLCCQVVDLCSIDGVFSEHLFWCLPGHTKATYPGRWTPTQYGGGSVSRKRSQGSACNVCGQRTRSRTQVELAYFIDGAWQWVAALLCRPCRSAIVEIFRWR